MKFQISFGKLRSLLGICLWDMEFNESLKSWKITASYVSKKMCEEVFNLVGLGGTETS